MSFKTYLKSKMRYLLGIAMIAALLSQLISPLLSAKADSPRFNFLTGDYQILEGLNATKGEDVWKNPVTGAAGEEFRGSVYYHNGMLDTTATNTKIKVTIPATTSGNSAKITASISADNAETVTSTIVDGTLVGMNGLVVNLDKDAELEFVPGSVKWYPNSSAPGAAPTALPFGQSGNEITSGYGVNIGDIQGCWQFAGFLTFGFKTKAKPVVLDESFTIDKTVRNITKGFVDFAKDTSANLGDEVEFKIEVENTGEVAIVNGVLKDVNPAGLEYVNGSFSGTDASAFFDGGIHVNLTSGQKASFKYKAVAKTPLKAGDCAVNKAYMTAFEKTLNSQAAVNILAEKTPNIVKHKSAFNNTKNQNVEDVKSSIGDKVTYTLTTSNTGDAAIDFVIADDIKEVMQNALVTKISDGGEMASNIIKWPSVRINPGENVTRTFEIRILTVADGTVFKNIYGDTVTVTVEVPVVTTPVLHMEKLVRNVTTNDGNFVKSNQAYAGDTLEYLINYSNTGNGPADRVRIIDVLPANTQYIAGTTRISRNGGSEQTVIDGITGNGIVLDTIPAGEVGFIKLRVITSANLAVGETLVNTATVNTLSDTASTSIVAKAVAATVPTLPKTGATGAGSFMVTMFMGMAFLYGKYKKLGLSGETEIIKSLLS